MAIDINALLLQGRAYGGLTALEKRRVYAAILCEIVQAGDPAFDCSTVSNGCVSCLSPEKLAFLQVQLLCRLNQVDEPAFDCDPQAILQSDPCIACLEASVLLTLITTMAADTLIEIEPAAETDPNVLLTDNACVACLDGQPLEVEITLLLIAWLEQFETVDIDALVSECDACALNTPGGASPLVPLLPLQVLQWEPVSESPPETFFILQENDDALLQENGDNLLLELAP